MNKIRILTVPSDKTGCGNFRNIKPHLFIDKYYNNEFHVTIDYEPKYNDIEYLKNFDIIHFHKTFGPFEEFEKTTNLLKNLNIKSILDIDDYWTPLSTHPSYNLIMHYKMPTNLINNIKLVDYVMTTTDFFAEQIKKYNKNVVVIPNAIDLNEEQYIPKPIKSEKIRIGWAGGSSHECDLNNLNGLVNKLKNTTEFSKIQMVLCGYDTRGYYTIKDPQTNQTITKKINPLDGVWYRYEKIFTDNFSIIDNDYKNFLLKFIDEEYPDVEKKPYRRIWTKPITTYAEHYNYFDISLAPLKDNLFNKCKSELKVIEAGVFKKALIAQDIEPYRIKTINLFDKNGKINENGNIILIDNKKNHKDWFKSIKFLVNNPDIINLMGENLHKMVTENYSMEIVTQKRIKFYKKIVE